MPAISSLAKFSGSLSKLFDRIKAGSDRAPPSADLVYLAGQTRDNESSVLEKVYRFSGPIGMIGYDDVEKICGFAGFTRWKNALVAGGISAERIVGIEGSFVEVGGKRIIHTLSEHEAMARYAASLGKKQVLLIAPYWHILRCFLSAVLAGQRHYPEMQVYPVIGMPLDWGVDSKHSQGTLGGIRADFMFTETLRIFSYYEQGNLASPEEAMEHLDRAQVQSQ
jgi:hypothetical protein